MQTATTQFKNMVEGNDLVVCQAAQITLPIVRTNLCTTPSFANGLGKWQHSGLGLLAISPAHAVVGTQSMLFTFGTGGAFTNFAFIILDPLLTRGGGKFAVSLQVWLDTGCPPIDLGLSNGIGGGNGPITTTGSWQTLYSFTSGGGQGGVVIWNTAPVVAGTNVRCWVDAVLTEESPTVNSYFDGNSPNGKWFGIPYLTPSTLNTSPYSDYSATIESLTIDRQLTTSLPDGTTLITGYPTAQATLVLSGQIGSNESQTVPWLFDPFQTASPMYRHDLVRSPIVCQEGLYDGTGATPELITDFTGYVDDSSVDTQAGTVTLTCLDNRTNLRSVPILPALAATMDIAVGASPSLSTQTPGLTSLWVFDVLLRANGYSSSPGPRITNSSVVFYASFAGSAYPTVYGSNGYPVQASNSGQFTGETGTSPMQFVGGAFNDAVCRDVSLLCTTAGVNPGFTAPAGISVETGGGYFHEWWMNTTLPASGLVGGVYNPMKISVLQTDYNFTTLFSSLVQFTPVSGMSWNFTDPTGAVHAITMAGGWQQFSVQVDVGGSTGAETNTTTLWIDRVLVGTWTAALSVFPVQGVGADAIAIQSEYPLEAFQTTNELNANPLPSFTATAVLNVSLNNLVATTDITGQDPWQVIQQLAEAEQGVAGFDEYGIFRFTNRQSLVQYTAVRTITSATSLEAYQVDTGLSLVTNHVSANVNAIVRSPWQTVWSGLGTRLTSDGFYYIPAGTTDTILAALVTPSIVGTLCGVIPTGGITSAHVLSGYRADKNTAGTGGQISNLVMTVQQLSPVLAQITVNNPNPFNAYFVTPTGYPEPAGTSTGVFLAGEMLIAGTIPPSGTTPVLSNTVADSQWPPVSEGGANPQAASAIQLPDNPWRQDLASVQQLTDDVLGDLYRPRPIIRNLTIVADPRLQLGDRVTIVNPDTSKIAEDMAIIGIRTDSGNGVWQQSITARSVSSPGGWIMGQVGRSEIGVNTYV